MGLLVGLTTLTGLAAGLDWWAVATRRRELEHWAKPAVMLGLIALAVVLGAGDATAGDATAGDTVAGGATAGDTSAGVTAAGRWLLAALALGAVGDVLLLGDRPWRFLAGLAAFLVGHLGYVACFLSLGLNAPAWAAIGGLLLLASLTASRPVLPNAWRDGGLGLAAPVALYMAVIGAMLVTAWMTGRVVVGIGATVFVVSDTILALDRFVDHRRWAGVAVMVTYHLGQAVIVVGVLGAAPF